MLFQAIEVAHAADPERISGRPAESVYGERIDHWVRLLVREPTQALLLAARCQHLERWVIPRSSFPLDRAGYHRWRRAVQQRQGQRAAEILTAAGAEPDLAQRVGVLVAKDARDADGQVLEDAACLVFIEHELGAFAIAHPDYERSKFLDIIRKTWNKMSPHGQRLAMDIPLASDLKALVGEAVR